MSCKLVYMAVLLLTTYVSASAAISTCPKPKVRKRTIIQSDESISNGAQLIAKDIVDSARECYNLCCSESACNTAIMHYKQKTNVLGEDVTEKYCYLFYCGYPSVCSFQYHHRYAVIELDKNSAESDAENVKTPEFIDTNPPPTILPETTTALHEQPTPMLLTTNEAVERLSPTTILSRNINVTSSFSEVHTENHEDITGEKCPPGTPVAMCSDDPCKLIHCPSDADAVCKRNYCGGCNAVFYNSNGDKVNCSVSDVGESYSHNEEAITITEGDYDETPEETLASPKASNMKEVDKDPYYSGERRKWLEVNDTKTGESIASSSTTMPIYIVDKVPAGNSMMSLPLLIALIICIILLIGLIYRVKCAKRGKAKKVPVDDGDYLINGMYL